MLLSPLTDLVAKAFAAQNLPTELGRVITADRPDLADVQCNGALQGAKLAGKAPRAIAESIVAELQRTGADIFSEISIAGPGFINFKIEPEYLAKQLAAQDKQEKFGLEAPIKPETYLIEYVSANLGKDLHIGHLRNAMIGDAVRRLVAYKGYKVITDNHLGDWGLPMGQILSECARRYPDLLYFKDNYNGPFPEEAPISFADLCEIYPAASKKSKAEPEELKRAQQFTAQLQKGHPGYRALWQYLMKLSIENMNDRLHTLGVPDFDTYYGESYMDQFIPFILEDMKKKGITEVIDGAVSIRVQRNSDKFDIPPLVVEKSMGGVTYAATDIATFYQRKKDFNPDVVIILTDFRQELHFERMYRASVRAGYAENMKFVHLMYGTINDNEGKPYKTRSGGVPGFNFLIDLASDKASERLKEIGLDQKFSTEQFHEIAKQIGLASIKFGDLINYRRSDYIFDVDRFVSFEGKTGPYIQYTVVRATTLIAKAAEQKMEIGKFIIDESQHEVALLLLQFPNIVEASLNDYAPNVLADYLFRLAQTINKFYQTVPVLIEPDEAKRGAALAVLSLSARILTTGLDLLGIKVPKQM
jgi:arginyl-tRNA synthetase